MLDSDAYAEFEGYITLKQALDYATRKIKNREIAKVVLKQAFESGDIQVLCRIILEEYALGHIRSFEKRRENLQIDIKGNDKDTVILVPMDLLKPIPKGAQVIGNWSKSDLAWTAPPSTRAAFLTKSVQPHAALSTRKIMYGVRLKRVAVEAWVSLSIRIIKDNKSDEDKVIRAYRTEDDYKILLSEMFDLAENGKLRETYCGLRRNGIKARIAKFVRHKIGDVSEATAKRIATRLVDRDIEVKSNEQQLTNNDPNMN